MSSPPKKSKFKFYLETCYLGALRGLTSLPFEHPFETIKTRVQSELRIVPFRMQIKEVYNELGLLGFYSGLIPNSIRVMIKQAYRWPMMIFFPNFYQNLYPSNWTKRFKGLHKVSSGITIACIETFFVCPIERLKVFLMTRISKDIHLMDFFRSQGNYKAIIRSLFNGLQAQLFRQIVSWTTFLYFENRFKRIARNILGTSNDAQLSLFTIFCTSTCTGIVNVLIVQPIDLIKTLYQMQMNEVILQDSFLSTGKMVYKLGGIRSLYIGWEARIIQYIIQTFFTSALLEYLEHRVEKL